MPLSNKRKVKVIKSLKMQFSQGRYLEPRPPDEKKEQEKSSMESFATHTYTDYLTQYRGKRKLDEADELSLVHKNKQPKINIGSAATESGPHEDK